MYIIEISIIKDFSMVKKVINGVVKYKFLYNR